MIIQLCNFSIGCGVWKKTLYCSTKRIKCFIRFARMFTNEFLRSHNFEVLFVLAFVISLISGVAFLLMICVLIFRQWTQCTSTFNFVFEQWVENSIIDVFENVAMQQKEARIISDDDCLAAGHKLNSFASFRIHVADAYTHKGENSSTDWWLLKE